MLLRCRSLGGAKAAFPRSRHFQSCDRDQPGQGCVGLKAYALMIKRILVETEIILKFFANDGDICRTP
jgi:hypothetical protein